MKRQLQTLVIIITAVLFFTACQKEETPKYDLISGTLTPGASLINSDFTDLEVHLWRLHDSISKDQVNEETTAVDFVESHTLNAEGTFIFSSLEMGDYVLKLDEGFLFGTSVFYLATIDGQTENKILQTVELKVPDNLGWK